MQQHTVQTPYMVGEVHFYSAELDGGPALFDTGPPTPEGEAALLESIDLTRLKFLMITHCHVDHYGLANYILQHSDAEVSSHAGTPSNSSVMPSGWRGWVSS